jgi:cytochrome c-type biogenesis protein CcmE
MSGSVVPGTIEERDDAVRFVLTEGGETANVRFSGSPPDLFADCAPVVVEGRWDGATFVSDELLIKHGNEYEPPDDEMGHEAAAQCPERPDGT